MREIRAHTLTALVLASLALGGCNPIEGALQVHRPASLQATRNAAVDPFCVSAGPDDECPTRMVREVVNLVPGSYQATLDLSAEHAITLTLKGANGRARRIEFPVPGDLPVPRHRGRFLLPAARISQPLDLRGRIDTDVSLSEPVAGHEHCSRTVYRLVCHRGKDGRRHCRHRDLEVDGVRHVEFRAEQTTRSVRLDLTEPRNGAVSARFDGAQRTARRRYLYQGACL